MAQPTVGAPQPEALPFRFRGNTEEYFRIWIVNLCLTVVTLGMYGPWAKVRNRRYFAGNLAVGDSTFEYDADPKRILIGRLIVLAGLGLYSLADKLFHPLTIVLGVAWLFLYPAAAVRSTAFHHRHTLFRGIRFSFFAPYTEAAMVLLVGPIFAVLSLGLAFPWWYARRQAFVARHSCYGTSVFGFDPGVRPYYGVFARASLIWIGAGAVAGAIFFLGIGAKPDSATIRVASIATGIFCALAFGAAFGVFQAGIQNLMYRNARIGDAYFRSEMRAAPLAWIYVTSGIAVILSLGLLTPWARVRQLRYRASTLALVAPSGIDAFVAAAVPEEGAGALASEMADFFDFDLGL